MADQDTKIIRYTERLYKYRLVDPVQVQTNIFGIDGKLDPWLEIRADGMLFIAARYLWDGPSNPAIDSVAFMRPSLVHDALCDLMDARILDEKIHWGPAVDLIVKHLKEDQEVYVNTLSTWLRPFARAVATARRQWVSLGLRTWGKIKPDYDGTTEGEIYSAPV